MRGGIVDVPGVGPVAAPILATRGTQQWIIGVHGPLTLDVPPTQELHDAKEYGGIQVPLIDDMVIARNLPFATNLVIRKLHMSERSGPSTRAWPTQSRTLPELPDHWSYSTLKEIEACPRQYVLGRASYPELWDRSGISRSDRIRQHCSATSSTMRWRGSSRRSSRPAAPHPTRPRPSQCYVNWAATQRWPLRRWQARLARLDGNPRVDEDRRGRLQQLLEDRIPEARTEIQGYLQRMALIPKPTAARGGRGGIVPKRRPLGVGSHPEASLRADELRVKGRVDLITVTAEGADIVDHKTGAQDPSHLDQLRFYAMLWDQDEVANSARTPVGTLTASYPTTEESLPAPDAAKNWPTLASRTAERVAAADGQVVVRCPGSARLASRAAYCSVRSLCDAYWSEVVPDPAEVTDGTWFDYEGVVAAQNGVKSWWMRDPHDRRKMLVRTPPGRQLSPGQRLRILGLRREDDPELEAPVATLTTSSELFVVVGESD